MLSLTGVEKQFANKEIDRLMDDDLQSLRRELAELDGEFNQKIEQLTRRIDLLESKPTSPPLVKSTSTSNKATHTAELNSATSSSAISKTNPPPVEPTTVAAPIHDSWTIKKEVRKQSVFSILAPLFGPLAGLIEQFASLYKHYQKQGKAPVFFMTLAGIVALIFGFGYLLQYSFSEYLGPAGKLTIGFAIAIATTAGGIWFIRKRPAMAEYGSGIVALGVILNYLCAYFSGPYYGLLPDLAGFLLLVSVTAIAYVLALLFETRIVAIVTLVGGAALPLVMGHIGHSPLLYLAYLLVLAGAMSHLSFRIRWQPLAWVSMVVSAGMVEFSIANTDVLISRLAYTEPYGLIAIIHGFFYLFGYYGLKGLTSVSELTKTHLMMVSANILFYLLVSQQLVENNVLLGSLYLLSMLPWLATFMRPAKVFAYLTDSDLLRTVQALALLHAGLLAGVGILVLSSPALIGIIWCIEALMLIYLGGKFRFGSVRIEGYIALLLSLLVMGSQVLSWVLGAFVAPPALLALTLEMEAGGGWVNLIAITLLVYVTVALLTKQGDYFDDRERHLIAILDNLFSVCLSLSFLLTIGVFWPESFWAFAIIPMFYLIWRAQSKALVFTELFGLAHFLLLLVPMMVSAGIAGNFHFSEQSIYGQFSRVEAFVCLWLIAEFYKRYCSHSANAVIAENLRKIFYGLIPVLFLPGVLHLYSDYFPLALWLSSIIALLLYYRLQFRVLKHELQILVIVASIVSIVGCWRAEFGNWQGHAAQALIVGVLFYLFIGWSGQALRRKPEGSTRRQQLHWALAPMFSLAIYYFATAIFITLYGLTANLGICLLVVLLYFTALFSYQPVSLPVRSNLRLLRNLMFVLLALLTFNQAGSVLTHSFGNTHPLVSGLQNVIALACVAFLVYGSKPQNRAVWRKGIGVITGAWIFNLITIAAYVLFLSQLFSNMLGPIVSFSLVVHGTVILFQTIQSKMKKLIWLSLMLYGVAALKILLWDMNDFSLIQKIVVFMLIGSCMLGAAFRYQKRMMRDVNPSIKPG